MWQVWKWRLGKIHEEWRAIVTEENMWLWCHDGWESSSWNKKRNLSRSGNEIDTVHQQWLYGHCNVILRQRIIEYGGLYLNTLLCKHILTPIRNYTSSAVESNDLNRYSAHRHSAVTMWSMNVVSPSKPTIQVLGQLNVWDKCRWDFWNSRLTILRWHLFTVAGRSYSLFHESTVLPAHQLY